MTYEIRFRRMSPLGVATVVAIACLLPTAAGSASAQVNTVTIDSSAE